MELDAFIESHVKSLRSEAAARPPNPAGCLAITKVAKHSSVCLLATYRSSGPYFDFLNRYLNFVTWFAPYLAGMLDSVEWWDTLARAKG